MRVFVIYDSAYGNTEQIARAIAGAFNTQDTGLLRIGQVSFSQIKGTELVIIGSPTNGGRATQAVQKFLNEIPESALRGTSVAAFDTRLTTKLVAIFGYAAGKIASNLKRKGGSLVLSPEGFFVKGTKGPLKEGELERAANWAKRIAESQKVRVTAKT